MRSDSFFFAFARARDQHCSDSNEQALRTVPRKHSAPEVEAPQNGTGNRARTAPRVAARCTRTELMVRLQTRHGCTQTLARCQQR